MKASILGIGTELTDGQILNKNATWISSRLKKRGLSTSLHLVVPDERKLILEAIDFCASKSDVVFITGGLGPTSDDFTRDIITEWAGLKLEWHEASWQMVTERLMARGYTVKEIQRQQCFFPKESDILINDQGTANAFSLITKGKKVFALPGPPREIEAVWDRYIDSWLTENTVDLDPVITRTWDCLGVGESDVATITEDILKDAGVDIGYRVHLPYVEVKMTFLRSQEKRVQPFVEKLTEALQFCLVTRDEQDVMHTLSQKLSGRSSVCFQDAVSGSYLANRVVPSLRSLEALDHWSFSNEFRQDNDHEVVLSLLPVDEHNVRVEVLVGSQKHWTLITAPYTTMNMRERRLQYFAEMALITWARLLP